jgi:predicted MFS family arabinose efflux permease
MVFATAFYLAMPQLIGRLGVHSIFASLAVVAVLAAAACAAWLPTEATAQAAGAARPPLRLIPAAAAACLCIALIFVGQSAVWNFVVAIGQGQGLSMQAVGAVMAACAAVNILGPLAGRLLGERLGLAGPMLAAFALLALDALLITHIDGLPAFAAGTVLLVLLPGFALPYAFAFLARLGDDRYAGAGPAFLMLGSAAGPALGAAVLHEAQVPGLGLVSATIVLVASGLLALTAMIGRRSALAAPAAAGGG